jgi:hypothetical protein
MKIDKGYLGMGFVIFCLVCAVSAGVLSVYADPVESAIEIIEESSAFIHIDHDSGFLSSSSVMASYQAFEGNSGHIWVRVERYGFDHAFEFSVDTVEEAETILRGLAE